MPFERKNKNEYFESDPKDRYEPHDLIHRWLQVPCQAQKRTELGSHEDQGKDGGTGKRHGIHPDPPGPVPDALQRVPYPGIGNWQKMPNAKYIRTYIYINKRKVYNGKKKKKGEGT